MVLFFFACWNSARDVATWFTAHRGPQANELWNHRANYCFKLPLNDFYSQLRPFVSPQTSFVSAGQQTKKGTCLFLSIICWKSSISFTPNLVHYRNNSLVCFGWWWSGVSNCVCMCVSGRRGRGCSWCVILLFSLKFHVLRALGVPLSLIHFEEV